MRTAAEPRETAKARQSRDTQERLIAAARALFGERGYAATATEELVARAGMTRGALYHQYRDKRDLFRAVFEAVEQELGRRVSLAAAGATDPWERLRAGARAVLGTADDRATRRIVFVDGPSVLGWEEWRRIDGRYSLALVRAALEADVQAGDIAPQPIEPLTHLIVGAINEAALALAVAPEGRRARLEFEAAIDGVLAALRAAASPLR